LRAHKWIEIRLATDDGFRTAYKLKARKRGVDVLREAYRQNGVETPTVQSSHAEDRQRRGTVVVAGVVMSLHLVSGRGGSLLAEHYTRDVGRALAIADRLESAGLRPNVVRSGSKYLDVYSNCGSPKACGEGRGRQKGRSALPRRKGEGRHAEAEGTHRKDPEETSPFSLPIASPLPRSRHLCALAESNRYDKFSRYVEQPTCGSDRRPAGAADVLSAVPRTVGICGASWRAPRCAPRALAPFEPAAVQLL